MLREGPTKRELTRTRVTQYFPTSLVLSPTRGLAMQINEEAQRVGVRLRAETWFCYCTGVASAVVYGGTDMRETQAALDRGCDILIGTPGRLLDLVQRGYVSLEGVT